MKKSLLAIAAAGMLAATGAIAQPYHQDPPQRWTQYDERQQWDNRAASVDEREARINARIQQGMSDGRISEWEARRLYRELRDVEARERAFKSDGRLSQREAETLNRDLDRLTGRVRQEIRD